MYRTLALLAGGWLTLLGAAHAQEPGSALVLVGKPYPQYQEVSSAFVQEWKRTTGKEPVVMAFPEAESERRQLLRARPNLVVGLGEAPTAWAVAHPQDFPLAFTMVVEPDRLQQVREASPVKTRKLMGISIDVPAEEAVAIVSKLMPKVKRIGVLSQDPAARDSVAAIRRACEKRNLQLIHTELAAASELPSKLDEILGQVDLFWCVPDPNVLQPQLARHIIGQCAARNVPVVGLSATFVKAGATLSFERDYREIGQLLARTALGQRDQSNSGPQWKLESPQRIVVSINQRSSEALGLKKEVDLPQVSVTLY